MRHATNSFSASRGFTLIEMIIAMVIGGVIVAMASMFVRDQINASTDVANRAALADTADTILRRMGREIQGALPNSVRVDGTGQLLEFIPVKDAGRYRTEQAGGVGNVLDFGATATSMLFDVFGPPVTIAAGDSVVVYNLGVPGANAYAGDNLRTPNTTGSVSQVGAAAAFQFPFASPSKRFQIVGQPVTFRCTGTTIMRYTGYGFSNSQPTAFAAASTAQLADDVSACTFEYVGAVLQRNGFVSINLTLTRNGESVNLRHQVEVLNTP